VSRKRAKSRMRGRKVRSAEAKLRGGQTRKTRADLERQLKTYRQEIARTRERLAEATMQQTATSRMLRLISSSPIQSVLDAVAENAARLCDASNARIWRLQDNLVRLAATFGESSATMDGREGLPLNRETVTGRAACDRRTIDHLPSCRYRRAGRVRHGADLGRCARRIGGDAGYQHRAAERHQAPYRRRPGARTRPLRRHQWPFRLRQIHFVPRAGWHLAVRPRARAATGRALPVPTAAAVHSARHATARDHLGSAQYQRRMAATTVHRPEAGIDLYNYEVKIAISATFDALLRSSQHVHIELATSQLDG